MSVTRINHFRAREGQGEVVRDQLRAIVPVIQALEACVSCQLLQDHQDGARFVVLEVWKSIEAHHAAAANIPKERVLQMMALLAEPPSGLYYEAV